MREDEPVAKALARALKKAGRLDLAEPMIQVVAPSGTSVHAAERATGAARSAADLVETPFVSLLSGLDVIEFPRVACWAGAAKCSVASS